MYKGTGLPRRFEAPKSIVRVCDRVIATSNEVGRPDTKAARPSAALTAVSRFADCNRSCTSSNKTRKSYAG